MKHHQELYVESQTNTLEILLQSIPTYGMAAHTHKVLLLAQYISLCECVMGDGGKNENPFYAESIYIFVLSDLSTWFVLCSNAKRVRPHLPTFN